MGDFTDSRRILGWPFFVFALPALLYSHFVKGDLVQNDFMFDPPETSGEWEALFYCPPCETDTENLFLQWRYPGHIVTRECYSCGDTFEVEDE